MDTYRMLTLALVGTGAVGCIAFVTTYWIATRGAWMRSEVGRFLMTVYANLAALFFLILLNNIFGEWPGRKAVSLMLFAAYAIFAWWPLRLLIKANGGKRG